MLSVRGKMNKAEKLAKKIVMSELGVSHPFIYAVDHKGKSWALTWDDLRYLAHSFMVERESNVSGTVR